MVFQVMVVLGFLARFSKPLHWKLSAHTLFVFVLGKILPSPVTGTVSGPAARWQVLPVPGTLTQESQQSQMQLAEPALGLAGTGGDFMLLSCQVCKLSTQREAPQGNLPAHEHQ